MELGPLSLEGDTEWGEGVKNAEILTGKEAVPATHWAWRPGKMTPLSYFEIQWD